MCFVWPIFRGSLLVECDGVGVGEREWEWERWTTTSRLEDKQQHAGYLPVVMLCLWQVYEKLRKDVVRVCRQALSRAAGGMARALTRPFTQMHAPYCP